MITNVNIIQAKYNFIKIESIHSVSFVKSNTLKAYKILGA